MELFLTPILDRPKEKFSRYAYGDGLATPTDLACMTGTLLPIAPCGHLSGRNG